MGFTSYDSIVKKVRFVREHNLPYFDYSFSLFGIDIFGLKIAQRGREKFGKSIDGDVQSSNLTSDQQAISTNSHKAVIVKERFGKVVLLSPEVATFYLDKDKNLREYDPMVFKNRYVQTGEIIGFYEVLGHIHEIKSPCNGKIIKNYVRDGQGMGFKQEMFKINPKKPSKNT